MNQQCKVCGEPAAGFHFGAFTCEGCKSFFGRSYNNVSSISECKNAGTCVINKKNRTSCKACRLRKCLMVGMSKSGSRYGRRSNWFKIHCLLQEQQQQAAQQASAASPNHGSNHGPPQTPTSMGMHPKSSPTHLGLLSPQQALHQQLLSQQHSSHAAAAAAAAAAALARASAKEELLLLGLDDYKHTTSPAGSNSTSTSGSSPESHNSDTSVEVGDAARSQSGGAVSAAAAAAASLFLKGPPGGPNAPPRPLVSLPFGPLLPHPALLSGLPQPPSFMFPPFYRQPAFNNNNNECKSAMADAYSKRFYLDALLHSGFYQDAEEEAPEERRMTRSPVAPPPAQDDPMDLSVKTTGSPPRSPAELEDHEDAEVDVDADDEDRRASSTAAEDLQEELARRSASSASPIGSSPPASQPRPLRVVPLDLSART